MRGSPCGISVQTASSCGISTKEGSAAAQVARYSVFLVCVCISISLGSNSSFSLCHVGGAVSSRSILPGVFDRIPPVFGGGHNDVL